MHIIYKSIRRLMLCIIINNDITIKFPYLFVIKVLEYKRGIPYRKVKRHVLSTEK